MRAFAPFAINIKIEINLFYRKELYVMKVRLPQGPSRNELMQQIQKMQNDATALQADLDSREYTATSGGGLITVTVTGEHEIKSIKIKPEALEDAEMVEDLLTVALNEAINNAKKESEDEMSALTGGLNIPGMNGMF